MIEREDAPPVLQYARPRAPFGRPVDRARREQAGGLLMVSVMTCPCITVSVFHWLLSWIVARPITPAGGLAMVTTLIVFLSALTACLRRYPSRRDWRNGFGLALTAAVISGFWVALFILSLLPRLFGPL